MTESNHRPAAFESRGPVFVCMDFIGIADLFLRGTENGALRRGPRGVDYSAGWT